MKRKLQKVIMAIVAITMFTGIMLLSVEKNNQGQWEFATISSLAQGGENGGGEECDEEPVECPPGTVRGKYEEDFVEDGIIVCVDGEKHECDKWRHTFKADASGPECGIDGTITYQSHNCRDLGTSC